MNIMRFSFGSNEKKLSDAIKSTSSDSINTYKAIFLVVMLSSNINFSSSTLLISFTVKDISGFLREKFLGALNK